MRRAAQSVPYWIEDAYMREPVDDFDDLDDYDVDAVVDARREERAFNE